jgi:hypothetical protein
VDAAVEDRARVERPAACSTLAAIAARGPLSQMVTIGRSSQRPFSEIAAAIGSSIRKACAAPAASTARVAALRSTCVIPLGTHTITLARERALPAALRMK